MNIRRPRLTIWVCLSDLYESAPRRFICFFETLVKPRIYARYQFIYRGHPFNSNYEDIKADQRTSLSLHYSSQSDLRNSLASAIFLRIISDHKNELFLHHKPCITLSSPASFSPPQQLLQRSNTTKVMQMGCMSMASTLPANPPYNSSAYQGT